MALLKKIYGQSINDLDRIVRLGYEQAKQVSGSDLEIGAAMSASPGDLVLSYAALSHAGVQKDENREVREKADLIFDIVDEFLANNGLSISLYKATGYTEVEQRAAKDKAKDRANELLKKIIERVVKFYPDQNLAAAAQTTFDFRSQDHEGMLYEKTGLDWRQLIGQLSHLSNLSRDNRDFQRFARYIAQNAPDSKIQKRALTSEFGESYEWNPLLEKEVKGFVNALGYNLSSQIYNNGELWSLLDTIVGHSTYDLAFDFERSIQKIGNKSCLDSFVGSISANDANIFLSKEDVRKMSKEDIVNFYAKLNHNEVNKEAGKESNEIRKTYHALIKEALNGREKLANKEEAEALADKLLQTYIKKRWEVAGGSDKVDAAMKMYKEDRSYATVILTRDVTGRGHGKREFIKQLAESNDLPEDQSVNRIIESLVRASVKAQISKRNLEEEVQERAMGDKDKDTVNIAQKFANAMGYKINEDAEVGAVFGIVGRTMYQMSYNIGDDFNKLYKKSSIINP